MRLLEPINGIKVLQGHYLMNLIFFIAMIFVKRADEMENLVVEAPPSPAGEHHSLHIF